MVLEIDDNFCAIFYRFPSHFSMRVFSQFSSVPGNMNSFKAEKRRPHSCSGKYGTIIV